MFNHVVSDRPTRLLSERQVAERLGLTPQQFIDFEQSASLFPAEVYLSPDVWGWVEQEVDDYLDLQIWRRDQGVAPWQLAQSTKKMQLSQARADAFNVPLDLSNHPSQTNGAHQ